MSKPTFMKDLPLHNSSYSMSTKGGYTSAQLPYQPNSSHAIPESEKGSNQTDIMKKPKLSMLSLILSAGFILPFLYLQKLYRKNRTLGFTLLAIFSTAFSLMLAFVLAQTLLLSDIDYSIQNIDFVPSISFASNLINMDSTLRTFTIDWYPQPVDPNNCASDREFVANIYLDQNLLDASSPGQSSGSSLPSTPFNPSASTAPPNSVMFQYDSSQACGNTATFQDSKNTFRTVSKLVDLATSGKGKSTLQAYPIDKYLSQISMYAIDNTTNQVIPMDISLTWGTVVNFKATLDRTSSIADSDGIYLVFDVERSAAVKLFVYCVIIANWIVTAAFLWLSVACLLWHNEKIIKEMFVIPVTALFAFTTVRANLPGAPAGFGAYVDFVGILPNLVLITLSSAALLLTVLARRVQKEIHLKEERDRKLLEKEEKAKNKSEPQNRVERQKKRESKGSRQEEDEDDDEENEEKSFLITVLTRQIGKKAVKAFKKKEKGSESGSEESSDSDEDEEEGDGNEEEKVDQREYVVLRRKKSRKAKNGSSMKNRKRMQPERPDIGRVTSDSSMYKEPVILEEV